MGRNSGFGVVFFAKPVVSLVGNNDTGFFGVNGSERKVLKLVRKICRGKVASAYGRVSEVAFGDSLEKS